MKALIFSLLMVGSLVAQATPTFNKDISPEMKQQILQDLDFIKVLNGENSSGFYKQIFSKNGLNGTELLAFFDKRIYNFGRSSCGGGPSVAACVNPWFNPNTMWITPNYEKNNMPQIYRISVIFHESRHTEQMNGGWGHVNCPTPYLDDNGKDIVGIISGTKMEGLSACDSTPLGAYGMQAVLLKNIENNCTSCNEKIRMDGKIFGDDGIYRISNLTARQKLKDDK